ncbi:MAG: hypothetical protein HY727_16115 [Candidatus Rokubacteria bacterium]|nr:hypothetical protein [Candidatus Rokubacteria bacterium]
MRSLALWVAWLCLVLALAGCGVVRLLAQGARALGRETQAEPHPLATPAPPPTDEAGAESPAAAAGSVPV